MIKGPYILANILSSFKIKIRHVEILEKYNFAQSSFSFYIYKNLTI